MHNKQQQTALCVLRFFNSVASAQNQFFSNTLLQLQSTKRRMVMRILLNLCKSGGMEGNDGNPWRCKQMLCGKQSSRIVMAVQLCLAPPESFAACMRLLMITRAFRFGRRHQSSPQQCYLHRLHNFCEYCESAWYHSRKKVDQTSPKSLRISYPSIPLTMQNLVALRQKLCEIWNSRLKSSPEKQAIVHQIQTPSVHWPDP